MTKDFVPSSIDRAGLENSLKELDALLEEDAEEDNYQKWFEKHTFVFALLGYSRILAKPQLPDDKNKFFVPDFMVQNIYGAWEIIDLKRAHTKIMTDKKTRNKFYASFEEYISQCREYSQFFEDEQKRRDFEQEHSITVQKYVTSTLIAGLKNDSMQNKIHDMLSDRGNKVRHLTYDNVRDTIELQRSMLYRKYENKKGFAASIVFILKKLSGKDNFLFDFGTKQNKNRVSLYIDPQDNLVLRIYDSKKHEYLNSCALERFGICYDRLAHIFVEFGNLEDSTIMVVESTSGIFSERILNPFDFALSHSIVMGSDIAHSKDSHMILFEFGAWPKTLGFEKKRSHKTYIYENFLKESKTSFRVPLFKDHKFLYAQPYSGKMDLIQKDPKHQPQMIKHDPEKS